MVENWINKLLLQKAYSIFQENLKYFVVWHIEKDHIAIQLNKIRKNSVTRKFDKLRFEKKAPRILWKKGKSFFAYRMKVLVEEKVISIFLMFFKANLFI